MGNKIIRIRTGGQSGVDRAAMDFAREHDIPLCGWFPKNGWAEDYPESPGLLKDYTIDPERRTRVHNSGKGAKYTRSRRPVELIYTEEFGGKVEAQRREYATKQLTRAEKERLIRMNNSDNLKRVIEISGLTGVKALQKEVMGADTMTESVNTFRDGEENE